MKESAKPHHTSCYHGRNINGDPRQAKGVLSIIEDLFIIHNATANNVKKKAEARINKQLTTKHFGSRETVVLQEAYAVCASLLLNGQKEEARVLCLCLNRFELDHIELEDFLEGKQLVVSTEKAWFSHKGLIRHVAKRIPCRCLDGLKRETKGQVLMGFCKLCSAVMPAAELKECTGCNWMCYCSKECQQKHWKCHKGVCRFLETYMHPTEMAEVD